ncbi:MAG: zinc-finger domain-containing protein [Geminicoccaceae bacterium]
MASEEFLLVEDREVVLTDAMNVVCDGGNGPLGHPREFMTLAKDGAVLCKYCGRRYVHLSNPEAEEIRAMSRPFAA